MTKKYNTPKLLLKDLSKYNLCCKEVINRNEAKQYTDKDDIYIDIQSNCYLCSFDKFTDTRLLLGIFKCVNTIKNTLITGVVLGVAGIILNLFVNK